MQIIDAERQVAPDFACVAVRLAALRVLVAVALAPLLAAVPVRLAVALARLAAGLADEDDFELEVERFGAGM